MSLLAADREMLSDLLAQVRGARPILIGAMAIDAALAAAGLAPLPRATRDWDFAVAIGSWRAFAELAARMVAGGAFQQGVEPHRFRHRLGGALDLVPFGDLEDPPGSLRWPSGPVMSTVGFAALQHEIIEHAFHPGRTIAVATLPALVGLKLVAYRDRRPALLRDVRDVHHIARVQAWPTAGALDEVTVTALREERFAFADLGAFGLGREVGRVFDVGVRSLLLDILREAHDPWSEIVSHAVVQAVAEERDRIPIAGCLGALRHGIGAES